MRDALQSFRAKYPRECLFPGGNFFRSAYLSSCDADVFTYFQAHLVTDTLRALERAYLLILLLEVKCLALGCMVHEYPGGDTGEEAIVSTAQVLSGG